MNEKRTMLVLRIAVGGSALALIGASACISQWVDVGVGAFLGEELQFGTDPGQPKYTAKPFVNWETPHVSPLAVTPDGATVLAVNTAEGRLWVGDVGGDAPRWVAAIPVGLDPVSVRARTDAEAWVVNHISDSVSIVDLEQRAVVRTLTPGDEPTDVVFGGGRAFVVCSQINEVAVYDLADLSRPPTRLTIAGEDPRAAAVSADGSKVFVAIFESGNETTIVPFTDVVSPAGPYAGQNPPPNRGGAFAPAAIDLPAQAPLSQIVKKDRASGRWLDDNGADWSGQISWDLHDHDLAVIDTATLEILYVPNLMNLNMHVCALDDGRVAVVGTDAINHVRFEPNVNGRFVQNVIALVDPASPQDAEVIDLNPHVADAVAAGVTAVDATTRQRSISEPRGVVYSRDGQTGYIAGLGSNNVAIVDGLGNRLGEIAVGAGPTGLALDEARGRLFVMEKFEAAIRVIDTATHATLARLAMSDPTPDAIKAGRPLLYDAHRTSGLGTVSCASCHTDARIDQLAWDLGDPSAPVKKFNQYCDDVLTGEPASHCVDFHPIKGPMLTQSLQDIIGLEPLHWRGDRENLAAFKPAYVSLLGAEVEPSDGEMAAFEAFLATIVYPPQPNRNLDNSLRERVAGGNAVRGQEMFIRMKIDDANGSAEAGENPLLEGLLLEAGAVLSCNRCHQAPTGTNRRITSNRELNLPQGMKVPQLRNAYERTGFSKSSMDNNRGFGFSHDGSFDTVTEFLRLDNFHFGEGIEGEQNRDDVVAFVHSIGTDTHAAVGLQVTLAGSYAADPSDGERIDLMLRLADAGDVDVIATGRRSAGLVRFVYVCAGEFESGDGSIVSAGELRSAGPGEAITWTVVPLGSGRRIAFAAAP